MTDEAHERDAETTARPIAIGFLLLAAPLLLAVFLAEQAAGRWANGVAALVLLGCGIALLRRSA